MAEGCPMLPCSLCDLVPGRPESQPDGRWRIRCPICGREAFGADEDGARAEWLRLNAQVAPPLSPVLSRLDEIEEAMCSLEAIRRVPGAMDVWQRWMDDLHELRRIVEEAERC